jgi:hypothetical protein
MTAKNALLVRDRKHDVNPFDRPCGVQEIHIKQQVLASSQDAEPLVQNGAGIRTIRSISWI